MKRILVLFSVWLVSLAGPAQSGNLHSGPVVITGKVIADATGQPVTNAHVYIVEGEEETLTDHNGEFRIESWQKAPLSLTVATYQRYSKTRIIISNPAQKQLIRLKIKSS